MNQVRRLVVLIVSLQVVATFFLWTLDALNVISEGKFAIFLAVDLLSFAMVAYIYRTTRSGEPIGRAWILTGSLMLTILLFSGLFFP